MRPLLKYWLTFTLSVVSTVFLWNTGLLEEIYYKDTSYASHIIFALFWIMSIYCGLVISETCLLKKKHKMGIPSTILAPLNKKVQVGWFCSEVCLALGMYGTIWGMCEMLGGFNSLEISNVASIQALLSQLGKSMATALYSTLTGLVLGNVLKIQYFNLELETHAD